MAREKICGIYCIENLVNGKKYIGQSVDIYNRWRRHKSDLSNNRHCGIHIQRSWNTYGNNNFRFYIIEICSVNNLGIKEQFYIQKYKTYDEAFGYNLTTGGETYVLTEAKAKENIKYKNELWGIPIYQINFIGEIVKGWESARVAARELKYHQSCIWNCLNGKRKTYKKFIWVYQSEYNEDFNISNYLNCNTQSKSINQYDMSNNLIRQWDSANSTYREGFDCSAVIKCCKGKIKHHKNYIWRYTSSTEDGLDCLYDVKLD